MIKSITVTNHLGESVTLELRFPEKSGFLVRSIDGLNPAKADINMTDLTSKDGSVYNSARVTSRNIVLTIDFLEGPTIEDTRQKSYKYFPIKKEVRVRIETDNRTSEAIGYIEANEINIFSQTEGSQISVICPDPYFYALEKTLTTLSGVTPGFEFPFSNESIEDPLIELGQIVLASIKNVQYEGDAEVGIVIYIHALGEAEMVTIYNENTLETMTIDTVKLASLTGAGITTGDDIIISTVKGNKFVYLLRGGVYTNILNVIERDASWFQLSKGENLFGFIAEDGGENIQMSIQHQTVYEGV